jgi:hypothetical protein
MCKEARLVSVIMNTFYGDLQALMCFNLETDDCLSDRQIG